MVDGNLFGLNASINGTVLEVDVIYSFGACTIGSVNYALVIIVKTRAGGGTQKVRVLIPVAERDGLLDNFIGSVDINLAGGVAGVDLTTSILYDGVTTRHDEESTHRIILEELNFFAVRFLHHLWI